MAEHTNLPGLINPGGSRWTNRL